MTIFWTYFTRRQPPLHRFYAQKFHTVNVCGTEEDQGNFLTAVARRCCSVALENDRFGKWRWNLLTVVTLRCGDSPACRRGGAEEGSRRLVPNGWVALSFFVVFFFFLHTKTIQRCPADSWHDKHISLNYLPRWRRFSPVIQCILVLCGATYFCCFLEVLMVRIVNTHSDTRLLLYFTVMHLSGCFGFIEQTRHTSHCKWSVSSSLFLPSPTRPKVLYLFSAHWLRSKVRFFSPPHQSFCTKWV